MTRPGWYQEPASARRRYWDGRAWSDHEPDPPRLRPSVKPGRGPLRAAVLTVIAVLVFGGLGVAVLKIGADTDGPQPAATPPSVVSGAAAPIGSAVRDGGLEFVVTALDSSPTAAADPNRRAVGRFVNVHVRVINIGAGPTVFAAAKQKLHAQGQEFPADPEASLGEGDAELQVNPGTSVDTVVSFDIPPTVASLQTIELHDTFSSGGARIALR